jgi:hypothetical protein
VADGVSDISRGVVVSAMAGITDALLKCTDLAKHRNDYANDLKFIEDKVHIQLFNSLALFLLRPFCLSHTLSLPLSSVSRLRLFLSYHLFSLSTRCEVDSLFFQPFRC